MPKLLIPTRSDSLTLPLREAAELASCSQDTLLRASMAGELPTFRLGRGTKKGKRYVKRATLLAWIDRMETRGAA